MRRQRVQVGRKYAPWGIFAALLAAFYQAVAPAEVLHHGFSIRVRLGLYDRRDVSLDHLKEVKLLSELPLLRRRIAGYEFGPRKRARYELAEWGTADVYLESRQPPYLLLRSDSAGTNTTIVNLCTSSDTQQAFDSVQGALAEFRRSGLAHSSR